MNLSRIAHALGTECPSDDREITAIAAPDAADEHCITFLSDPHYRDSVLASPAQVVIVKKGTQLPGKICLEVDDPYVGYAKTAQLFEPAESLFEGPVHPSAVIHPGASVHPTAGIGPNSYIGKECSIGEHTRVGACCVVENKATVGNNCRIHSGAVICRDVTIGNSVIIESGAVIGSEGFGNARMTNGEWVRIPSLGMVIIEDDAWIGANTCIDRGALGATIIKRGARLDNLIHIAHNCSVGENTAMAAQTGVSGSTTIGNRVIVAGQVGFVGHIEIGDDSFIGGKAGVSKSVPPKASVTGYPARDLMKMRRIEASQMQLPDLLKEIKHLRKEFEELKKHLND
jgi:UDP-3-O-[3-hydroxymyristoyl] glucosamine N-acyltransferase